jgi:hypothetical protein
MMFTFRAGRVPWKMVSRWCPFAAVIRANC